MKINDSIKLEKNVLFNETEKSLESDFSDLFY